MFSHPPGQKVSADCMVTSMTMVDIGGTFCRLVCPADALCVVYEVASHRVGLLCLFTRCCVLDSRVTISHWRTLHTHTGRVHPFLKSAMCCVLVQRSSKMIAHAIDKRVRHGNKKTCNRKPDWLQEPTQTHASTTSPMLVVTRYYK